MKRKLWQMLLFITCFLTIVSCSTMDDETGKLNYEETKKMVVDILKTDDGKNAIKEILADHEMKQELVLEHSAVSEAITEVLLSDKGKDFWKKSFADPEFAKTFADSMKKEQEELNKNLLKDPEYRQKLIEIMQDPEVEKEITNLLKSNEYRSHLQSVITETLESPVFQAKIQEILLKAASEQAKSEEEK